MGQTVKVCPTVCILWQILLAEAGISEVGVKVYDWQDHPFAIILPVGEIIADQRTGNFGGISFGSADFTLSINSGNSVCSSEKSVWNCHSLFGARFPSSGTHDTVRYIQRAGLPVISFRNLRHPYVKHTAKNISEQKQEP